MPMSFIQLRDVSFRYETQKNYLFKNVSFTVGDGEKLAIIGPNGSGKTTLAKLILKELIPIKGEIIYPKVEIKIGYLKQDFEHNSSKIVFAECQQVFKRLLEIRKKMRDLAGKMSVANEELEVITEQYGKLQDEFLHNDGYQMNNNIKSILFGLGFSYDQLYQPYNKLSGGEKTRVELAKMLLQKPDMLILDEPTNHLDIQAIEWLEDFLRKYENAMILISHDRLFIDRIADKIVDLRRGKANLYHTNYSEYLRIRQEEESFQLKKYLERQRKINQLKEVARKRRQWAESFQKQTRPEGGGYVFEMITNPAKSMMKKAKAVEKRIEYLTEVDKIEKPWQEKERKIDFQIDILTGKMVFSAVNISKKFSSKIVFHKLNLSLYSGDKLVVTGRNGSGKTTLLKIIAKLLKNDDGQVYYGSKIKIGYYAQEHEQLPIEMPVLDHLLSLNKDETFVRTIMGCLKIEREQIYQKISTLSVGERSKVALASILVVKNNVLILDEPTNHLDLDTREILENALADYPGTIVFVSHDRYFIKKIATRKFDLDKM